MTFPRLKEAVFRGVAVHGLATALAVSGDVAYSLKHPDVMGTACPGLAENLYAAPTRTPRTPHEKRCETSRTLTEIATDIATLGSVRGMNALYTATHPVERAGTTRR